MASDLHPEDRTAWLLLIGRRLRAEYDVVSEPVPPRLAALIEQLETSAPGDRNTGGQDRGGNPENGESVKSPGAQPCRARRV
jgi:hypothetical protein